MHEAVIGLEPHLTQEIPDSEFRIAKSWGRFGNSWKLFKPSVVYCPKFAGPRFGIGNLEFRIWNGPIREQCLGNRMKMRQFAGFPVPGRDRAGPPYVGRRSRSGWKDEKTVPTEAVGYMLAGGREGKMKILA